MALPELGHLHLRHGLEALRKVGVLPGILEAGFAIEDGRNVYLDHHGEPIVDVFYPRSSGGSAPIVGIRRAEMHRILAARLDALGVEIRLATTVAEIDSARRQRIARRSVLLGRHGTALRTSSMARRRRHARLVREEPLAGPVAPRYDSSASASERSVHERPRALDAKIMMMGVGKRVEASCRSAIDRLYIFGTVS